MTPEFYGRLLLIALPVAFLGAAPARATEPGPARPRGEIAAEIWRLRPAEATVPTGAPRDPRPATAIPEARRNVRVVYPALTEAR